MASDAYISATSTLGQGNFALTLQGRQVLSVGTFDKDGNTYDFQLGENYERFEYRGIARYGITSQLEVRGGGNYRQNYSWDEDGQRSDVRGPQWAMLGLRYSFILGPRATLAVDTEVRHLLDGKDDAALQLGNEGRTFRLATAMTNRLPHNIYLTTQSGFVMPAKDQSPEIDFDLSAYWNRRLFAIGAGFDGILSLGQDDYTDNPTDKPPLTSPLGNTQTINSINRSYYRAYGALQLALFKGWRLELRTGRVLGGTSWDQQGFTELGLSYRHGSKEEIRERRVRQTFKQYEIDALVLKVSPKGTLVKIDKGASSNVEKGMRFDIYETNFQGKNVLLAAGRVFKVKAETAIVKILKFYREGAPIKAGNAARGRR